MYAVAQVSSGPGRRNKPASPESGPPDALSALTGVKSAPPGGLAPLSKTEKRGLLGDVTAVTELLWLS